MNYADKLIECERQAMQDIIKDLRTDKKLMHDIIDHMAGEFTDEAAAPLVMAVLNGDAGDLLNKFTSLMYVGIKRNAEYRAIDMAEAWELSAEREHAERKAAMVW